MAQGHQIKNKLWAHGSVNLLARLLMTINTMIATVINSTRSDMDPILLPMVMSPVVGILEVVIVPLSKLSGRARLSRRGRFGG